MSNRFMGTRAGLPFPLGEGRGSQHQTRLAAAHAAPPDVRSGHRALRSLDTGWRSAILAPLASDAGGTAWAAPRGQQRVGDERTALPLPLGEGRGEGAFRSTIKNPKPLAAQPTRKAFTLVELLVVIGIIGALMALITPAVMNAMISARNAAIKTEIDMLHMAVMNYKNEYGSFPPCYQLDTTLAGPAVTHIRRLFPRCADPNAELGGVSLHPANALQFWLSGYTGDPENPVLPVENRKRLYDFDMSRLSQATGAYTAPKTGGTPYLYFDSSRYLSVDRVLNTSGIGPENWYVWRNDMSFSVAPPPPAAINNSLFLHPNTFIILSAGLDGEFYTDDDLSNAWSGTWQDWCERQQD